VKKLCTACRHPQRAEIDLALVGGEATRSIAKRINAKTPASKPLSHDAILRHKRHVGQAISKALARRGEDPPADALADTMKSNAADEARLEETLLAKVGRLEADARRIGERAENEGDLRAALVANRGLLDVIKMMHELNPPPKVTEASLRAEAEKMAAALGNGATADEILSLASQLAGGDYSGLGSKDFDLTRSISAAANAARTGAAPPSIPAPSAPPAAFPAGARPPPVPGLAPALPKQNEADEAPTLPVLARPIWRMRI
jgi:hypothetical protein